MSTAGDQSNDSQERLKYNTWALVHDKFRILNKIDSVFLLHCNCDWKLSKMCAQALILPQTAVSFDGDI